MFIADIIDFKSDSLDANDPAAVTAKKELYRPQLKAYRSAVEQLYGDVAGAAYDPEQDEFAVLARRE